MYKRIGCGFLASTVRYCILTLLGRNGLDVSNIRGQSYDGASAMAGTHTGTQARIKQLNLLALYTHCHFFINSKFLHRIWYL